jgi:uncharacterized protein YggE
MRAAVLLLCLPAALVAQVRMDDGEPRVVASATRTARLVPDKVSFYTVVEGAGENSVDAAERSAKKTQAVTDAIKALGGRAEILSSVPFGVAPAPNYGGYPGQPLQNPYVGRQVIRVQLSRVDQLTSVAGALIAAGATGITSPQFESSAADSARRAKMAEAIAGARADAEALAAGVGMRLGALIEVSGIGQPGVVSSFSPSQFIQFGRGFESMQNNAPPEITVGSGVTVRYRLVPR